MRHVAPVIDPICPIRNIGRVEDPRSARALQNLFDRAKGIRFGRVSRSKDGHVDRGCHSRGRKSDGKDERKHVVRLLKDQRTVELEFVHGVVKYR